MVFEHLFYPDNPRKRQKVIEYQVKFRRSFEDFKSSWNKLCESFNIVVREKKPDWVLRLLTYDSLQSAEYILGKINEVLEDAKSKVRKIGSDIGIENLEGAFEEMNPHFLNMISKAFAAELGILATGMFINRIPILWQIFKHLKPVSVAVRAAIKVTRGLIGFVIIGVALVAITDIIIGDIQRKELEDAIKVMKKFDEGCIVHLDTARREIDGINQNIRDRTYIVDDEHVIVNGVLMLYRPS
ncbi:hypothetical protein RclHR1_03130021 [Rhizophagus clarus]|uniref:Uncharacterized protein n=1 Tax=Rhizophagus clarus TaxID=94130 RepID=A0A2Z6R7K2_9GLOM|nr:hypothetical protein RclHR1_03130021 [Rhizophagus clarus]GES81831.1 hypothetical protein RCL2_000907200 [Rhizophagus clarus]